MRGYQEKEETQNENMMGKTIIKRNFLFLPFFSREDDGREREKGMLKLSEVLNEVPAYIKINVSPINSEGFLLRMQDLQNKRIDMTKIYREVIKKEMEKRCFGEDGECNRYNCTYSLVEGLRSEDGYKQNLGEVYDILSLICLKRG